MKTNLMGLVFIGIASLGLTGCVLNVGDSESGWDNQASWEKSETKNRANLARLSLGMSRDQVQILMGQADFNEAYIQEDKKVHVLFYRTQHMNGDGKTTKDECTPVVISNGALVGWGEKAYGNI